jgi:hypothetical protein
MSPDEAIAVAAGIAALLAGGAKLMQRRLPSRLSWRPARKEDWRRFAFPRAGVLGPKYWRTELDELEVVLGIERNADQRDFDSQYVEHRYWIGVDGRDCLPPELSATFPLNSPGEHPLGTALFGDGLQALDNSVYVHVHGGFLSLKITLDAPLLDIDPVLRGLVAGTRRASRLRLGGQLDYAALLEDNLRAKSTLVRERALRMLAERHPKDPRTQASLQSAKSDPAPELRLVAASHTGDRAQLEGLVGEEGASDRVRSAALIGLWQRFGGPDTTALALGMLESERPELAREAVRLLAFHCGALEAGVAAQREAAFIRLLEREEIRLRVAAAVALGQVGGPTALAALRRQQAWLLPSELAQALSVAMDRIQTRAGGLPAGSLSFAESPGGSVSIADD